MEKNPVKTNREETGSCLRNILEWNEKSLPAETEGVLYYTENDDVARMLFRAGYAVLGIIPENLEEDSQPAEKSGSPGTGTEKVEKVEMVESAADFRGIPYLAEREALDDWTYLEQVYCRCHNLPYTVLDTPRCVVRETIEEDVDAFYTLYEDEENSRFMEPLFPQKEQEIAYITSYRENVYAFYGIGIWTVLLKETGEIIGRIGIEINENGDSPQLGYFLGRQWQHKGIAKEVCSAVLTYGFRELDFEKIEARTDANNKASLALLRRLGFTYEKSDGGLAIFYLLKKV